MDPFPAGPEGKERELSTALLFLLLEIRPKVCTSMGIQTWSWLKVLFDDDDFVKG